MANFKVEVSTLRAEAKLKGVRGFIREIAWYNAIGDAQVNWVKQNIGRAGLEEKWQRMAPNTLVKRPDRRSTNHFSRRFHTRLLRGVFKEVRANSVAVGNNAEHADLHHEGTSPHVISARNAARLRFRTVRGWVQPVSVEHPGFPARRILPSEEKAKEIGIRALDRFVAKIRQVGNS